MQKQKSWQLVLITAVILLTIYNIFPTVFYYSKPLKSPISEKKAYAIAKDIELRVNALEDHSVDWIKSYCSLLQTSAKSIELGKTNPQQVAITFENSNDATAFKKYFPRAGALIPFVPSQMSLLNSSDENTKKVVVQRQIPVHFDTKNVQDYFTFINKFDENKNPTKEYRDLLFDRVAAIGVAIGGESESAMKLSTIIDNPTSPTSYQLAYSLAQDIIEHVQSFGENSTVTKRYFSSFTQGIATKHSEAIKLLSDTFDKLRENVKLDKTSLSKVENPSTKNEKLALLEAKEMNLVKATNFLKKHEIDFESSSLPWDYTTLTTKLENTFQNTPGEKLLTLKVDANNPIIKEIVLDWTNEKIFLKIHDDLSQLQKTSKKELEQLIINEIAKITNLCDENISRASGEFLISTSKLSDSNSLLVLQLKKIAESQAKIIKDILQNSWNPSHEELRAENFPVYDYPTYLKLPDQEKSLCFVVYSPSLYSKTAPKGLRQGSIYVMAKGLERIIQKYQDPKTNETAQLFMEDFDRLKEILRQNGFTGFPGVNLALSSDFTSDFIFEKDDFYNSIIKASREDFNVFGSKKYAALEFSTLGQRILTTNNIETQIHEDLIKWNDEYNSAKVSFNQYSKFDVPSPTKNLLFDNFILSMRKYFRGDERKILHWGLDLSGGKTVQLELKDQNNKVVKSETELRQGVNELYNRVNKMGVSDVNIRIVDNNIILDFPGAQNLSASELIKASTMYFHVVNEKFTSANPSLSENVNRFLQEVWNEAIVTNRKDIESVNLIAIKHLYGDSLNPDTANPRSEAAKVLFENGLRLASVDSGSTSLLDETLSKISMFRGKEYSKWEGQTNPLIIVFNNYSLEGSSLTNIRSSYDPSKGNYLSFEVKGSQTVFGKKINSKDALHNWTSRFSKEKISGTTLGQITKGRGWRMAVILNDSIISSPNLESALRDSAMITGSFTQREVNQLTADLKAGSLSFTPHILSEKNVSPELGHLERTQGILATIVALIVVFISMVGYYKFSGLIASIAVIFNLLIMWATLQNIQATMTLAGIAGIILTVGMAVDANVLVFERFKEEFALSGNIRTAIEAGYKKAFSAILDSNVTTIIAALILLNFDSGPIKGFAITLIIGIVSSMFTALFMTKYYFTRWASNPKNTKLTMSNLIKGTKFQFLKNAKYAYSFSILTIIVGISSIAFDKNSILGMDFTGGFALNIELADSPGVSNYRLIAEQAFEGKGTSSQDFQVRELNSPNNLRILFGTSMELESKPFHNMPIADDMKDITYKFENNPRIKWVVSALKDKGLSPTELSLTNLDKSWTAMSGQMSENMRNNAIYGLCLALIAIFAYITWRFEFKYAISAILCLVHDVLITIGSIALLNLFNLPIQLDLHAVAAIMTIVGYSLNDTIIIFDRIREDSKLMRKISFEELTNRSLNTTLSRTTITSLSTVLVLLSLVFLGGSTIFSFALLMTLGIVYGTLSSIFIASPLMLFFHKLEVKKHSRQLISE